MFINHRQGALKLMVVFIMLDVAAIILSAMAGYSLTVIDPQEIGFWIMLFTFCIGVFTFTWATIGAIWNYIDYKSLSQGVIMDFDLDAIEKEMDKMTQEMSSEELAEMEKEIKDSFEFGKTFEDIFGA